MLGITLVVLIYGIPILLCLVALIKNNITCIHHCTIYDAISAYRYDVIHNHDWLKGRPKYEVDYNDMEDYDKTFGRLWDWSYKRILPADKFKIIEPYIKTKGE